MVTKTDELLVEILSDLRTSQHMMAENITKFNDAHQQMCLQMDKLTTSNATLSENQKLMLKILGITVVALAILAGAEKILGVL